MFAFYAVLSYTILIQTRRSSTLHLIAHVEEKFVPNVLFDTVTNLYLTPYFRSISHFWLITGFVTRLTRRVPLVELELLLFPEHLSPSPVFSGVGVTPYLVICVFFVDRCLSFSTFSFGHCVVCSSSIYGFWLPLWYLRNPRTDIINKKIKKQKHNVRTIPKSYTWRQNGYHEHAYR